MRVFIYCFVYFFLLVLPAYVDSITCIAYMFSASGGQERASEPQKLGYKQEYATR